MTLVGAQRGSFPPQPIERRVDQVFLGSGVAREVPVRLRGWVREPPERFDDADRIVVEAESLYKGTPVWGGVRVTLNRYPDDPPLELRYGEQIEILARFREVRNFNNPGSFDRVGYLAKQGIFIGAVVRPRVPIQRLGNEHEGSLQAFVWKARDQSEKRFESLWGGSRSESLLRALLLGDASLLDRATTTDFQRTGAYHALVISGLHIGLLAFALLAMLRLLGLPVVTRAVVAMSVVIVYVTLLGARLPVTRAAMMLAAFLIASLIFRRRQALNVIAAVACGFLLADPDLIADAGFQMSFLAVAVIAAIAVPLLERTVEPYRRALVDIDNVDRDIFADVAVAETRVVLRNWLEPLRILAPWPPWLTTAIVCAALRLLCWVIALGLISVVIQLGLALPLAYHFQRVSFSGVFANVLLMPLLSIVIPCGLAALATSWELPAVVASVGADMMAAWTAILADALTLDPRPPPPPAWLAFLLLTAVAAWAWSLQSPGRRSLPATLALVCLVVLLCVHPFSPQLEPGRLELTAIDVGQGESLLVAFPNGRTLLMDGGGRPDFGRSERDESDSGDTRAIDIGDAVVSPYLWSRSIQRLDVVAVSHPDADHIGGIPAILENFAVAELWLGADSFESEYAPLVEAARKVGTRIVRVSPGEHRAFGAATVEVIAPATTTDAAIERNNLSLVLGVRFQEHEFLLTGDIEELAESALLRNLRGRSIDVLKVAHHGSRGSTTASFLSIASPLFAMVSAGYDNTYRHPHVELLDRLREARTSVLRTDLHGAISILSDGHRLEIRRYADHHQDSVARP